MPSMASIWAYQDKQRKRDLIATLTGIFAVTVAMGGWAHHLDTKHAAANLKPPAITQSCTPTTPSK